MHGNGLYSYPDGSEFFGTLKEGSKISGKFKYANGDLYVGEFEDGLKSNGVLNYSDGNHSLEQIAAVAKCKATSILAMSQRLSEHGLLREI